MPTMTASQVYAIISGWSIPLDKVWGMWKTLYNYLPPPPTPYPVNLWALAQAIAAVYDGPVRP